MAVAVDMRERLAAALWLALRPSAPRWIWLIVPLVLAPVAARIAHEGLRGMLHAKWRPRYFAQFAGIGRDRSPSAVRARALAPAVARSGVADSKPVGAIPDRLRAGDYRLANACVAAGGRPRSSQPSTVDSPNRVARNAKQSRASA